MQSSPIVSSSFPALQRIRQLWRNEKYAQPQKKSRQWLGSAEAQGSAQAYMTLPGKAVWMERAYAPFANEGYARNVIAFRCIELIASGASHVSWKLNRILRNGVKRELLQHPLLALLQNPNPYQAGAELWHQLVAQWLISGNAYVQMVAANGGEPRELYALRPDRVRVIAGNKGLPAGYRYQVGETATDYPLHPVNGRGAVLHLRRFHPLNDWYGLSPMEAAAYSIDQHNQAASWNQALLQNGARPSGALVVRSGEKDAGAERLNEEQYWRLKQQIDEQFSSPANAGRPLLLEGGLEWKEMSLSPRDMDFIEAKHSAARDIALAFGVPPQLLGIPGDNTYSNLAEARLALWEQTILPLVDRLTNALNGWIVPAFGEGLQLAYDTDGISALTLRRDKLWERVQNAGFLSDDEKRALLGFAPRGQQPAAAMNEAGEAR
jgi:HK97 family phage portal protein